MTRLVLRDSAVDDINAIADHIAQDNPEAARNWYDAVLDAANQLAQMPGMGAVREFEAPELAGLRSWPIKGFRSYLMFYRPIKDGVDVTRVIHGARDLERVLLEG
jgi:toxin ParE1/3/4